MDESRSPYMRESRSLYMDESRTLQIYELRVTIPIYGRVHELHRRMSHDLYMSQATNMNLCFRTYDCKLRQRMDERDTLSETTEA